MSTTAEHRLAFERANPGIFFLDPNEPDKLERYLETNGWLHPSERIEGVKKAGEGNMNCTMRVRTNRRSFVVKQARPWVEKYAQFEAPAERAQYEIGFYRLIGESPELSAQMPAFLFADESAYFLGMSDLGEGTDFSTVYSGDRFSPEEFSQLLQFLLTLHSTFRGRQNERDFSNHALRRFNHGHIFVVPMDPSNGLDLDGITPGLAALATELHDDRDYRAQVEEMGRYYLEDGDTLIHGDFFPGSYLRTAVGLRVIDPEFCCFGRAEVELGIFIGHMLLARQDGASILNFLNGYTNAAPLALDPVLRLAGVEIMRRLIGVAQLPVTLDLEGKKSLLETSRKLVLEPSMSLLTR
ncbi:MAG: aminoglycoside phosphotransferase [Verrucomicrobia bacterium]|nr:aminoglycoside phosphotransferase [Verrucomicrobiota bacterium]